MDKKGDSMVEGTETTFNTIDNDVFKLKEFFVY